MNVSVLLFNNYGRLRSGWRFLIFIFSFGFFAAVLGILADSLSRSFAVNFSEARAASLVVNGLFSLVLAIVVGWLCGKYLEALPFRALGAAFTKRWLSHLVLGVGLGALTIGLAVGIALIFGGLSFTIDQADPAAIFKTLGISLVVFAAAAASEEAIFRGYILQTFSRAGLAWFAIALTSVFFAVLHLYNPGANLFSTANTAIAGVWFGIAYLKTRDLWFPFGIHLMWNWMQGAFFGIEVSGLTDLTAAPLLKEIDRGPAWLTGENYGIEAGIACTIALIVSTVAIYFMPGVKPDEELLSMTNSELPAKRPTQSGS